MGFAEHKARSDGATAVVESAVRGLMVRAASGGGNGAAAALQAITNPGGSGSSGFGSGNKARQFYRLVRNWVAACTKVVATRVSAQPWMAGYYTEQPEEGSRGSSKPGKKPKHYNRSLIPRTLPRVKEYGLADLEPEPNHPSLWTLDRPNHVQGRFEFLYMIVMNLLITGEWYVIGGISKRKDKRDKKKAPKDKMELWAIPSSMMEPDHSQGLFGGYKLITGMGGQGIPIPAENVARGYFVDPSDPKGCMSPLITCLQAARIDDFILSSQEASFERGINPNLLITIGKTLDAEGRQTQRRPVLQGSQRRQIIRAVRHVWSQTVNQGDPAILDGLIEDVKKLQMTPQEMDWKQSGEIVKARIMQAYNVNPIVIGEVTPSNKAQAVVAETNLCNNAVNPIIENISCAMSEFLSPFYEGGDELAVWLERSQPHDDELEHRKYEAARRNGDITEDEFRAYMNLPPAAEKERRNALLSSQAGLQGAINVAAAVGGGQMSHDNGVALLAEFLQLPEERVKPMVPDDPPEPTIDPFTGMPVDPNTPPGAPPQGGPPEEGDGKPPKPKPKPGEEEKPEPLPDDIDDAKSFNPDQPRDEGGRWAGDGSSGGDAADEKPAGGTEHSYGGDTGTSTVKVDAIGQVKLTKPRTPDEASAQLKAMTKIMDAAQKDLDGGVEKAGLRFNHVKVQLARAIGYAQKFTGKKDALIELATLIEQLKKKYKVEAVDPDEVDEPTLDLDDKHAREVWIERHFDEYRAEPQERWYIEAAGEVELELIDERSSLAGVSRTLEIKRRVTESLLQMPPDWLYEETYEIGLAAWEDLPGAEREAFTLSLLADNGIMGKYNPDQPRDELGRFGEGGGGTAVADDDDDEGSGGASSGETESAAGELASLHERISKPDGGFTYQPVTDEQPKTGYALSPYPERSFAKSASELSLDDIADYVEKNADLLVESEHFLGAWHDPASGKVFLDVSIVTQDEGRAGTLAREKDQIAYFDLGKMQSVTVNADATSGGAAGGKSWRNKNRRSRSSKPTRPRR